MIRARAATSSRRGPLIVAMIARGRQPPAMRETSSAKYSRQELFDLVWSKPLAGAATEVGLSANGLAKLCDRLLIPRPSRTHWTRQGKAGAVARPPLPPAPSRTASEIIVGAEQFVARRARTRLSPEDRRDQLMDTAANIVLTEGLSEVTLKRLARDVGISEAQAHNCFAGRADLLASLARRELQALEQRRQLQIARGEDNLTRIILSTLGYFHEAIARGPVLQILMRDPEVRASLQDERQKATETAVEPILDSLASRYGMSRAVAFASTTVLTAVTRRAGGLLASGRTTLEVAERLCLPMIIAGANSNAEAARTPKT
jgi:AcrR family transcriptional regulator